MTECVAAVVRCGDRGISRALVGDKAADLLRLYLLAQEADFHVPSFTVLPATVLGRYYAAAGWQPELCYPDLPLPDEVPPDVAAGLQGFPTFAAPDLRACMEPLDRPLLLRTSLVPPARGTVPPYGINTTQPLGQLQGETTEGTSGVLRTLLSGLYKAYTTWSAPGGFEWIRRDAAVIFMEALPFSGIGTAYVEENRVTLEVDGVSPPGRERHVFSLLGSPEVDVHVQRMLDVCAKIRDAVPDQRLIEVEFGFRIDDRPSVVQIRTFSSPHRPDAHPIGAFHSIGTVAGRVHDLRDLPRGTASLVAVLSALTAPSILVLRRDDRETLDAFALSWGLDQPAELLPGISAIILEEPAEAAPGTGFRNHLVRALMHRYPQIFFAQVAPDEWPVGAADVSVTSDGSVIDVQPA